METENVNVKNWKSLIKPSKLDVKISDDLTHAKIIAEPLEKRLWFNIRKLFKKNSSILNQRCSCNINSN
jgi:hypothetical protein